MFCRDGRLFAQPFDPDALKTSGDPVVAAESVGYLPNLFLANFSVSSVGSLVLGGGTAKTQMTWLDRKGRKIGTAGSPDYMESPRLSPDASRVALERIELGGIRSLWVLEFSRGILSRVADRGAFPAWSSDGHELVYMNFEENTVIRRKYGSSSPGEVLTTVEAFGLVPIDWSPDGRYVAYTGRADLFVLPLHGGERKAQLFKRDAIFPRFSPNGKWIAYTAGGEVFVEGFPEGHAHGQVSQGGAAPDGSTTARSCITLRVTAS